MNKERLEAAFEQAKQRGEIPAHAKLSQFTVEMTVHRAATGNDEHYGIVAAYHKNPLKHALLQLGIFYRGLKRKYGRSSNKQG